MIGIHTKNKVIMQTLLSLFSHLGAAPWQPNQQYQAVVLYLNQQDTNHFFATIPPFPCINLGAKNTSATYQMYPPFHLYELQDILLTVLKSTKNLTTYENAIFSFNGKTRTLLNKKTSQLINLTEKENDLIAFLVQAKNYSATKEQILSSVWQYCETTETHTIESHIYTLRQKLGQDADSFIKYENGIFSLIS